jgi:hypothetical protein
MGTVKGILRLRRVHIATSSEAEECEAKPGMGESESKLGLESCFVKDSDSTRTRELSDVDSSHSSKKVFIGFYKKITIYKIKFSLIDNFHPNRIHCARTIFSTAFSIYIFIWS